PCGTSGLYGTPTCCEVDVLGVADLVCSSAPGNPSTAAGYRAGCAAVSRQPKCCVLKLVSSNCLWSCRSGER
ncbi:hypothetical protein QBC43DRAFT_220922, partial [Cladorrhinum sp. PSN259]